MSLLQLPPLSLYVHIPWCVKKCPYCDFNSHESKSIPEQDYVNALVDDLNTEKTWAQGRKLHSIFFGGGTPSLFSAKAIEQILNAAEKQIGFADNIEITLEANPGTFEQEKFAGFYQAGINRLSIGIQSFQEKHLKKLGRIHNSDEAKNAITIARKAGFNNINLDLMHGLPEQSQANALDDLATAIALSPEHLSWYQLTIEPNTVFYNQPPTLPEEKTLADIQLAGLATLEENGYQQYEVSAYSKNKQQAKHNLNYWQFGDYLGIGAGAHGKITDIKNNTIFRRQKTRLPEHYLNKNAIAHIKNTPIATEDLSLEFLMNGLRLVKGVSTDLFQQTTGLPYQEIQVACERLQEKALLEKNEKRIQTTMLGMQYLNSVLAEFMEG